LNSTPCYLLINQVVTRCLPARDSQGVPFRPKFVTYLYSEPVRCLEIEQIRASTMVKRIAGKT